MAETAYNDLGTDNILESKGGKVRGGDKGYASGVKSFDEKAGSTTEIRGAIRENTEDSDKSSFTTVGDSKISAPNLDDPFPIDPTDPIENQEFTLRAVVIGAVLGALINASNLYLGLKTGITFGAGVFGAIMGYASLRVLMTIAPRIDNSTEPFANSKWRRLLKLGDPFGPKETMLMTSTATSAGAMGGFFASVFPAFYQMDLLSSDVKDDAGRLITLGLVTCYYGMVFAIPLRKLYILKMKLPFPGDAATAFLIRSLLSSKEAAVTKRKTLWLLITFVIALVWRVTSEYAPGIMWNWHIFWWMYRPGGWDWIIAAENWGWWLVWSPAYIGIGVFIGLNGASSFLGGSVLAWGIIGPLTVSSGVAVGTLIPGLSDVYPGYQSYFDTGAEDPINAPPPRLWLVWSGVMMMICTGAAEVALEGKTILRALQSSFQPLLVQVRRKHYDGNPEEREEIIYDPAPIHDRVPFWMWGTVLFLSVVATCLVLGLQFHETVGITILGLVLSFIFTFASAETFGRVSVNANIGATANQLVLAGVRKGQHNSQTKTALSSLWGNTLGTAASQQACDILGNLKTAHLLGASPRVQFYGQLIGGLVSTFLSVGLFILFTNAFPCIIDKRLAATCTFSMPTAMQSLALTQAMLYPKFPISKSAGYTALAFGILSIITVVAKRYWVPERFKNYIPNFSVVGLAFVLPGVYLPAAIFLGCLIATFWQYKFPKTFAIFAFPIAVGAITGEGIGGVINAILEIAGVGGSKYGATVACPAKMWAGCG